MVSRHRKRGRASAGATESQFQAGGFSFHPEVYEWPVVGQAGTSARFKGSVLGQARVKAATAAGPIAAGDLLAVGAGGQAARMGAACYLPGSLVGTAMEGLDTAQGSGLIWVLVNPR